MKYLYVLLAVCVLPCLSLWGYPKKFNVNICGERDGSRWTSLWCDDGETNRYDYKILKFRRTFDLKEKPKNFKINVSADNRYRLFVNGKTVAAGPARGDVYNWYYDTLDIAPHLQKGKNTIAVMVWNMGDYRPCAQITMRTAFILDGAGEEEDFVSTPKKWKFKKSAAYKPVESFALDTGAGDEIDASKFDWGWTLPSFDDSSWKEAKGFKSGETAGGVTSEISWMLTPRAIGYPEETPSRLKKIRRFDGMAQVPDFISGKSEFVIPPNTKCSVLLDNEVLTTAYPKLLVSGGKGASVEIKYAEALFDAKLAKGNRNDIDGRDFHPRRLTRDIFRFDGGNNREFSTLWYRTYRYVGLYFETKDEPLAVKDFYGMFTAYPFAEKGYFKSDDKSIDKIWEVGWRTSRLCAHESYMDCPYYEQLQYIGDTRIQALISLYVSGDDRLMRQAIELFDSSRSPFGITASRYPSSREQIIPPFALYWISMIHDYAMLRGDRDFVKKFDGGIHSVLGWFLKNLDGGKNMLKPRMPFWNFADWCTTAGQRKGWHESGWRFGVPPEGKNAGSAVNTLHFAYTLRQASDIFKYIGDEDSASKYDKIYSKIVKSVYERCYDKNRGLFADYEGSKYSSQNVNIMAILADALPESGQGALMEKILKDGSLTQCTFYYRFYLTEAMAKTGRADEYVSQLKPWRDMIDSGLTTFAENPEPARSDCHAWSASPNYHLLSVVCGITPADYGFKKVKIAPSFGGLKEIEGSVPHAKGDIRVSLKKTEKGTVSGKIWLPTGIDGEFVWEGKTKKLKGGENIID